MPNCEICNSSICVYTIKADKIATRCNKHKLPDMVNINKLCVNGNCTTKASFKDPVTGKTSLCSKCSPDNAVSTANKKCIIGVNCNGKGRALFCDINSNDKKYCGKCRPDNTINTNIQMCKGLNCNVVPTFNLINLPPEYCKDHKTPAMVDVIHDMCITCRTLNISKRALFDALGQTKGAYFTAIYCKQHIPNNVIF